MLLGDIRSIRPAMMGFSFSSYSHYARGPAHRSRIKKLVSLLLKALGSIIDNAPN
jgi:hypothetical protein